MNLMLNSIRTEIEMQFHFRTTLETYNRLPLNSIRIYVSDAFLFRKISSKREFQQNYNLLLKRCINLAYSLNYSSRSSLLIRVFH